MNSVRRLLWVFVLVGIVALPPVAEANCAGTTCGGYCNVDGENYACIVLTDTFETNACKTFSGGCMSMASLLCCPRIPRE